jgi:hypothetical protein
LQHSRAECNGTLNHALNSETVISHEPHAIEAEAREINIRLPRGNKIRDDPTASAGLGPAVGAVADIEEQIAIRVRPK